MPDTLPHDALRRLLDTLIARFAGDGAPDDAAVAAEIATVSEGLRAALVHPPVLPPPASHGVTKHLPQVLALAARHAPDLAAALAPVGGGLPWRYGYLPRGDAPGLENEMAWAELVGPLAPWRSDRVCLGLTLIGAGSYYPDHRHPALELYAVVAGEAEWSRSGETSLRPPGSRILHRGNEVHAMRTGEEPLLAIYSWSGDVVSPSVYV